MSGYLKAEQASIAAPGDHPFMACSSSTSSAPSPTTFTGFGSLISSANDISHHQADSQRGEGFRVSEAKLCAS